MKIGVFGGTFNPPHLTHLNIANAAVAQLNLDKLLVFPCGDPPHKICSESAAHRLDMTRLAFADVAHAEVDTFEIDRQGKSYTLDTLRYVREKYPSAQLFLVIGGDSLRDLDGWHCPDEICRIAVLAVACRKDVEKQQSARRAKEKYGAEIVFLDVEPDDASSTEIRLKRQFNLPITEVDLFTAVQHFCRRSLKKGIGIYVIALRQTAALRYVAPNGLDGLRKAALQPGELQSVRIEIGVIPMPADMIPMDVGGNGGDRLVCQRRYGVADVADTESRINEQTPFRAV